MSRILKFSEYSNISHVNEEEEGGSYIQKLHTIAENATSIINYLSDTDDLDAWIQDKITITEHNMQAILDYYKSISASKDK